MSPAERQSVDGLTTLRRIETYVCDPCLVGEGSECHTPGCMFWMHDVPTEDTAHALRSAAEVTS